MKEMLFIMVAVLVPPTLTFFGVVGENPSPRAGLTWHAPSPAVAADYRPTPGPQLEAGVAVPCWPESSIQAHQQPSY